MNGKLVELTVRDGVMFWYCFTCNRIVQAARCAAQHEVAAILPPPLDVRVTDRGHKANLVGEGPQGLVRSGVKGDYIPWKASRIPIERK